MAKQTQIPLKSLLLWAILLTGFTLLNRTGKPPTLPLPPGIEQITIRQAADKVITLNKIGQQWLMAGKTTASGRADEVLDRLRACNSPYPDTAITPIANPHPVTIILNNKRYILGGYNSYRHSHYLDDGTQSWLCDESLKAIVAQPARSWLPPETTAAQTQESSCPNCPK